jgi:biotin transport system substrate-specific component
MENKRVSTQKIVLTGMMAAVMAVMSQIQFPLPSGVPVTMQTFAMALAGYVLGWQYGLASTAVYILLGAVGVPVFAGFSGGLGFTTSAAGGYIWGFLPMVALCGLGYQKKQYAWLVVLSLLGLASCHILGVIQFSIVTGMGPLQAALVGSVPYLVKDIVSLVGAYIVAKAVRAGLGTAGLRLA